MLRDGVQCRRAELDTNDKPVARTTPAPVARRTKKTLSSFAVMASLGRKTPTLLTRRMPMAPPILRDNIESVAAAVVEQSAMLSPEHSKSQHPW